MLRKVLAAVCLFTLVGLANTASAEEGGQWIAGTHYEVLEIPVSVRDESKLEVVEVFSYACIHCYNFDPYVKAWSGNLPDDVDFRLLPAIFNSDWEKLAQAFYTAEALGAREAVHTRMFEGIHNNHEDLRQPEILTPIFADLAGVEEQDFHGTWNSFSVKSRIQQAKGLMRAYRITGVPTLIVNGKYKVDGRMAGGNVAMLEVVDFLLAQERAAGAEAAQQ